MKRPTVWIAGGTDKGNDYTPIKEFARRKVKALVCMGVDNTKLLRDFQGIVPEIRDCHTFEEAMAADAVGRASETEVQEIYAQMKEHMEEICDFLKNLSGIHDGSGKGYYEGTYQIKLLNENGAFFSIAFGLWAFRYSAARFIFTTPLTEHTIVSFFRYGFIASNSLFRFSVTIR